jgi:hypothetical protein
VITVTVDLGLVDLPVGVHTPDIFWLLIVREIAEHTKNHALAEQFRGLGFQDDPFPITKRLPRAGIDWWMEPLVARVPFVQCAPDEDDLGRKSLPTQWAEPVRRRETPFGVVTLARRHEGTWSDALVA